MSRPEEEGKRLKEISEQILKSMYGILSVWYVAINKITKENDTTVINGIYASDYEGRKKHNFKIQLDNEYHLIGFERT